ncbi:putative NAD(P)-binding protein [Actinocorallia herbida]|uniref:Putative NAD(P)-binding protein n=1 Tax=Actinocorallia herbida TaxID=58109 RepID=A0A3N1D879_9ACTN|nr:NAD(P)-binding oxidoreductase [Actinocorallia herbida]ROO89696.1 putative NAD(P)-binding protein [Actinocorallia herbida]
MRIVIAGGHGQIALHLLRQWPDGSAAGLVRNPVHLADLEAAGQSGLVLDLERTTVQELAGAIDGFDALVFAAGAGPGSGAPRKRTVDQDAAILCAAAAERAGVDRFVQISAMGADTTPDPAKDEVWAAYIEAKANAEADLRSRDLDWTILRPGLLTDDPAKGRVLLAPDTGRGAVPRADVAAVIAAILGQGTGVRQTLELIEGDTPVDEAVAAV